LTLTLLPPSLFLQRKRELKEEGTAAAAEVG